MRLDKIKNTFNDYKLELSWGQLESIRASLERDHSDPVADEMLAEFEWYMERVAGPGEDEEQVKMREEGGMPGEGGAAPGEEQMGGVAQPPTEGGAIDTGAGPGLPPEEMPGGEQPPEGGEPQMAEPPAEGAPEEFAPAPAGEAGGGEEPMPEEADQHLAAPPAE